MAVGIAALALTACGSESDGSATRPDGSCSNLSFAEGHLEDIVPARPVTCEQAGGVLSEWSGRYFTRDTVFDADGNGWFCTLNSITSRNGYKASCTLGLNGAIKLAVRYDAH